MKRPAFASHFVPSWNAKALISKGSCARNVTACTGKAHCPAESLDEALHRGYVQNFGSQITLDENGFFPQRQEKGLSAEQRGRFGWIATEIVNFLGNKTVPAVFVRGSILTSNILHHSKSDFDLVIFVKKDLRSYERGALKRLLWERVKQEFSVGRLDIRYIYEHKHGAHRGTFRVGSTMQIVLRYFAIPIHGSREDVGIADVPLRPFPNLAIDIRRDVRYFHRTVTSCMSKDDSFTLHLAAVQWLCKKCLRAQGELASMETKAYARDLLPCHRLGSIAFPAFRSLSFRALLIACACPTNRYADMRKEDILLLGTSVALQFAEVVEDLALKQTFGTKEYHFAETPPGQFTSSRGLQGIAMQMADFFKTRLRLNANLEASDIGPFRAWPLPDLKLRGIKRIEERLLNKGDNAFAVAVHSGDTLDGLDIPVVYRANATPREGRVATAEILTCLLHLTPEVTCRAAPGPQVTFCRTEHPWFVDQTFTPPSKSIKMAVLEALERMREKHELSTIWSEEAQQECIYIQTPAVSDLKVFEKFLPRVRDVTQEERLWISSHGTVSTLHYDACHSALYQRCGKKRMVFFPPNCLRELGIYPLGHPLHRRGRVDLSRRDTVVFKKFWESCAAEAREVTLDTGDLLLFPPFWAHYTESRTASAYELSVSHTFRYIPR